MAIKFANSNIEDVSYNVAKIDKFNGVDYTTTPINVDETRAVDISNYLPYGNALAKRYGITKIREWNVDIFQLDKIISIFKFNDKYVIYAEYTAMYSSTTIYGVGLFFINDLTDDDFYDYYLFFERSSELDSETERYAKSVQYEQKLFILCEQGYFFIDELFAVHTIINNTSDSNNFVRDEDIYIPFAYTNIPYLTKDNLLVGNLEEIEQFNILSPYFYCQTMDISNANGEYSVFTENQEFDSESELISSDHCIAYRIKINDFYDSSLSLEEITSIYEEIPVESSSNSSYLTMRYYFTTINDEHYLIVIVRIKVDETNSTDISNKNALVLATSSLRAFKFKFYRDNSENITKFKTFKNFIPFGVGGYSDRLFFYGSDSYKNLDMHTCYASQSENRWLDYTYLGEKTYQTFGTSDSKITGYGILSNGVMAVFKESRPNQPNLYFRSSGYTTSTKTVSGTTFTFYEESFTITVSGVSIGSDFENQVIQFGNDLLINTNTGIYRISVGTSTATQTYYAYEVSYLIRDNLSSDMTNAKWCVLNDKLYIYRLSVDNKYRIYVADLNRYATINGNYQYEWWVIDDIELNDFVVLENDDSLKELYILKDSGLFSVGNKDNVTFKDYDYRLGLNSIINGTAITNDISKYGVSKIILSSENEFMQNILNADDVLEAYKEFMATAEFKFLNKYIKVLNNTDDFSSSTTLIVDSLEEVGFYQTAQDFIKFNSNINLSDYIKYHFSSYSVNDDGTYSVVFTHEIPEFISEYISIGSLSLAESGALYTDNNSTFDDNIIFYVDDMTYNGYSIKDAVIINGEYIVNGVNLGSNIVFNVITLGVKYGEYDLGAKDVDVFLNTQTTSGTTYSYRSVIDFVNTKQHEETADILTSNTSRVMAKNLLYLYTLRDANIGSVTFLHTDLARPIKDNVRLTIASSNFNAFFTNYGGLMKYTLYDIDGNALYTNTFSNNDVTFTLDTYATSIKIETVNMVGYGFSGVLFLVNLYNYYTTSYSEDTQYKIIINKPVEASWYSKFNSLGYINYLKTANYLYFSPESRRGGYTNIGYRTSKKEASYYSNASTDLFNFNDIDFADFSFGDTEFGRTYSSKKKIKNFSYIQLRAKSTTDNDSTLAVISMRYRYSKNNKGVK